MCRGMPGDAKEIVHEADLDDERYNTSRSPGLDFIPWAGCC